MEKASKSSAIKSKFMKKYYEDHKAEKINKSKEYYMKYRDTILKKQKESRIKLQKENRERRRKQWEESKQARKSEIDKLLGELRSAEQEATRQLIEAMMSNREDWIGNLDDVENVSQLWDKYFKKFNKIKTVLTGLLFEEYELDKKKLIEKRKNTLE